VLIYTDKPPIQIELGQQGENLCRTVTFNWDKWAERYPGGLLSLYFQRPDMSECYPLISGTSQNPVSWSPDLTAMSAAGQGKLIAKVVVDEIIEKSVIIYTLTVASPDFTETPPDAWQDWLAEIEQYAIQVNNSAAATLAAQLAVALAEQNVEELTTKTETLASQAEISATLAKESEVNAFDAVNSIVEITNQEIENLMI